VEPTSVTPFARPARDRALHAVLVALVRHSAGLPNPADAAKFRRTLPDVAEIAAYIQQRVAKIDPRETTTAAQQLERLLNEWELRATEQAQLRYSSTQRQFDVLLRAPGDGHLDGSVYSVSAWRQRHPSRSGWRTSRRPECHITASRDGISALAAARWWSCVEAGRRARLRYACDASHAGYVSRRCALS
jgi:hypothetical protein